jgi:hypothetical protein
MGWKRNLRKGNWRDTWKGSRSTDLVLNLEKTLEFLIPLDQWKIFPAIVSMFYNLKCHTIVSFG